MKTPSSQKLLWILSISFIIVTFMSIGIQHRRINHLRDDNQLQAVELSVLNDSVLSFESKNGDLTYKLSVVGVSHTNIKESLVKAGFEIKQLKDRDINWKKVNAALKLELEASGHIETSIKPDTFRIEPARQSGGNTDTVYFSEIEDWSNQYLSLYNGEIVKQKLQTDYRYKTGISIIPERKRNETIVSVFLTDPKAEITSANSITVKHEKRWYEKPWLWGVAGLTTGILITK
jgi:hypothetical protein